MPVASQSGSQAVESVGRVGELTMTFARRGRETVLTDSYSRSPWHCVPPITLPDGAAHTFLVNPSGGLVGGDRLSFRGVLEPGAQVLFSTPSANRVYRTLSEPAVQSVELTVSSGAILEWVPEVTIPYAGSRFRQRIAVHLEPGATALVWDAVASGRIARGERWAFAGLENEIRITTAGGASVLERYHLAPCGDTGLAGPAAEWDYAASFFIVGDRVAGETWTQLEEDLAGLLDDAGEVLGGVSVPAAPGVAVKLLARNAPALTGVLTALWSAARRWLWGRPLTDLRRS